MIVLDVLDGKGNDAQAHRCHVARRHLLHLLGKGVAVAVDILDGHGAENGAQVAFQRLQGHVADLVLRLGEEKLGRSADSRVARVDRDLRHAIHGDRHALARVHAVRHDVDSHDLHQQRIDALDGRPNKRAATADDAVGLAILFPPATRDHQHFIRANLAIAVGKNDPERQKNNDQGDGDTG